MKIDRRQGLMALIATGLAPSSAISALVQAAKKSGIVRSSGNPIIPFRGVSDPQVRVYDDVVYLYATHDASASNRYFRMEDWWVWRSTDLVDWQRVGVLTPEETYWGRPSRDCWATDAAHRNGKYFFYFSRGPKEIGVVESDRPEGPWTDRLKKPSIAKGSVPTEARDPGILQEADGTSYIVFGTWDYYIARLNPDMSSLAETPRKIEIDRLDGPYGPGKTDDKPFLHRHGNFYYLSWGCFYAMASSPYGPYRYKGSIIERQFVDPAFRNVGPIKGTPAEYQPADMLLADRHASIFELHGQSYFACNDQSLPGSGPYFRNSVLSYLRYRRNGEMAPIRLTKVGVGQYDASAEIEAADFFQVHGGRVEEEDDGSFTVGGLREGSHLIYPKTRNLSGKTLLSISTVGTDAAGCSIEVRRGSPAGPLLGRLRRRSDRESILTGSVRLPIEVDDICLVVRSRGRAGLRLGALNYS